MTHKIVAHVSTHVVERLQHALAACVVLLHKCADLTPAVLLALPAAMHHLVFVALMPLKNVYKVLVVILRVHAIMPAAHLDRSVVILRQVSAVQVMYVVERHQMALVVNRLSYVRMELHQILLTVVAQQQVNNAVQVVVVVLRLLQRAAQLLVHVVRRVILFAVR